MGKTATIDVYMVDNHSYIYLYRYIYPKISTCALTKSYHGTTDINSDYRIINLHHSVPLLNAATHNKG